jgi:hypothetical protein
MFTEIQTMEDFHLSDYDTPFELMIGDIKEILNCQVYDKTNIYDLKHNVRFMFNVIMGRGSWMEGDDRPPPL